ncbi:uncharacterized protein N7511_007310 [Penicillium nucicola]|uniref:uncharacterized protein n=1 Tax=Penicillium nucicola TaxID=1850975 RepID=UPI002544E89A|nr:uncharacterized protein N7511_007310 [Penicillium nucicola]KAJ5757128.1 hypothetical protein N7511_007310 [Penicillium nucicola]
MRFPFVALVALVSFTIGFPVDTDASPLRTSSDIVLSRAVSDVWNDSARDGKEESQNLALWSPDPEEHSLDILEHRAFSDCFRLQTYRTAKARWKGYGLSVIWIEGGAHVASAICDIFFPGVACSKSIEIVNWLGRMTLASVMILADDLDPLTIVNGAVSAAFGGGDFATSGVSDEAAAAADGENQAKRSLPGTHYHTRLVRGLSATGLEFETVEHVDVSSLKHRKRSNDEPDLTHRSIIRGAKNGNSSVDFAINHYSDGQASVALDDFDEVLTDEDRSRLNKRKTFSKPGLKFSFSVHRKIKLEEGGIHTFAQAIAKDWSETAFSLTDWGNYYGIIGDDTTNPYVKFKISAHHAGFALDYDKVESCGSMNYAL